MLGPGHTRQTVASLPIPSMTRQITVLTESHDSTAEASHLRSLAAAHDAPIGPTDVALVEQHRSDDDRT
ncbi:hypothetical protein GCM10027062_42930 [Nocardioides hungaricus]